MTILLLAVVPSSSIIIIGIDEALVLWLDDMTAIVGVT